MLPGQPAARISRQSLARKHCRFGIDREIFIELYTCIMRVVTNEQVAGEQKGDVGKQLANDTS